MKRATEQTFVGSNTYRYLREPAKPGQLRIKHWRYHIAPPSAADRALVQQCIDYWTLQSETFGLRFNDDMQIAVDYAHGVVTTAITVAEVMPGRRDRHYRTPRAVEKHGEHG